MRFENESRVDRVYDWVIHDAGLCRKVDGGGVEYTSVAEPGRLPTRAAGTPIHHGSC